MGSHVKFNKSVCAKDMGTMKSKLISIILIVAAIFLAGCFGQNYGKTAAAVLPPQPKCSLSAGAKTIFAGDIVSVEVTRMYMTKQTFKIHSADCGKNVSGLPLCTGNYPEQDTCYLVCGPYNTPGKYRIQNLSLKDISGGGGTIDCTGAVDVFVKSQPLPKCQRAVVNASTSNCTCWGALGTEVCTRGQTCEQGKCENVSCSQTAVPAPSRCGNGILEVGEQCDGSSETCPTGRCTSNCYCAFTELPANCEPGQENITGQICTCEGLMTRDICGPGEHCSHAGACLLRLCKG